MRNRVRPQDTFRGAAEGGKDKILSGTRCVLKRSGRAESAILPPPPFCRFATK